MKIALVGSTNSRARAPYDDPSWAIWAHACLHALKGMPGKRVDRWFDLHRPRVRNQPKTFDPHHKAWIDGEGRTAPIVLQRGGRTIPQSIGYPRADVKRWLTARGGIVDREYYTSTLSEMIALALYEGATQIGIWGCTFAQGEEYRVQRPCAEYWIGFARGLGVRVDIDPASPLCRSTHVYGFDGPRRDLRVQIQPRRLQLISADDPAAPAPMPIPASVQALIQEENELFDVERLRHQYAD